MLGVCSTMMRSTLLPYDFLTPTGSGIVALYAGCISAYLPCCLPADAQWRWRLQGVSLPLQDLASAQLLLPNLGLLVFIPP